MSAKTILKEGKDPTYVLRKRVNGPMFTEGQARAAIKRLKAELEEETEVGRQRAAVSL